MSAFFKYFTFGYKINMLKRWQVNKILSSALLKWRNRDYSYYKLKFKVLYKQISFVILWLIVWYKYEIWDKFSNISLISLKKIH